MSERVDLCLVIIEVGEADETAAEGAVEQCFDLAYVRVPAAPFQQNARSTMEVSAAHRDDARLDGRGLSVLRSSDDED